MDSSVSGQGPIKRRGKDIIIIHIKGHIGKKGVGH